ncbi:MAG: hypothetical protein SF123_00470 [Chloroflexota bacterium]|nr:hypothetical protein [Chloroflexota bacterium]
MTTQRKRIVRAIIVIVAILAVLLTMHLLINSFDLPSALRAMHSR